MSKRIGICCLVAGFGLAGCVQTPMGPTVQVLPSATKTFDSFRLDDAACRQFSTSQVAGQADAANNRAAATAVLGTVLGAGLGAAVGGGRGAAIGAASGAGVGTGVGADSSGNAQVGIQVQYDNAYGTCMWTKGNRVAGLPDPDAPVAEAAPHRSARRAVRRPMATASTSGSAPAKSSDWVAPTPAAASVPAQAGWVQPVSE